jgi:hypothetical protein
VKRNALGCYPTTILGMAHVAVNADDLDYIIFAPGILHSRLNSHVF